MSIKKFIKFESNKKYVSVANQLASLFQDASDYTIIYFNTNNVPVNPGKTHILTFDDMYYQMYKKLKIERDEFEPIFRQIQRSIIKTNRYYSYEITAFSNRLTEKFEKS
eukprot:316561_1